MKKEFISITYIGLVLILACLFSALTAEADSIIITNPIIHTSLEALIGGIIDFIFTVGLVVTPLMIIIAGIFFVTAAGNPAQVEKARGIILYTLIGLFIILLAKGLITFLRQYLGVP